MHRHGVRTPRIAGRTTRGRQALSLLLALSLVALLPAAPAAAQQRDEPISRLREQIAALARVDDDAATPPDIRSANRTFLDERRAQLLGMLKYKAEAVRGYLAGVGAHLTAAEKQPLENSLADLEGEIARVEQELGRSRRARPAPGAEAVAGRVASAGAPATAERPAAPPVSAAAPAAETGTSAPAPAAALAAAAPPPPQPTAANAPACYSDAPQPLIDAAQQAARIIVSSREPGDVFTQINPIVLFSIADAVSDDAEDLSEEERHFIDTIGRERAKAETRRTDKQVGASARSEGSTSAAEKPGFAEILGFAIEHGAIQQAVNGTTLTLSTSPYTLFLVGQDDTASAYQNYSYLSRLGISASFNINDDANPLTSARRQQLTEWSAKLRLSGDPTARSFSAQRFWDEHVRARVGQFPASVHVGLARIFDQNREISAKERALRREFSQPPFVESLRGVVGPKNAPADSPAERDEKVARVTDLVLCQARAAIYEPTRAGALPLSAVLRNQIVRETLPETAKALAESDKALADFRNELDRISKRPAFTFAYTNKRDPDRSDYSNFRLLYSKKTGEGLNVVGNAGLSFYHRPDTALNQQRLRDLAAALSFEGILGRRSPFLLEREDESKITFAFTGRYQRTFENRGVAGRKADIAVAQFKVEMPFIAGMTLPFSVTYANATELIKEDHVRANFGFTLDTDKLLQIIRLGNSRAR